MLNELTLNQVEKALQWLDDGLENSPPPGDLLHLSEVEWLLLQNLLSNLYQQRKSSPLH
jgi:hypothetical protein